MVGPIPHIGGKSRLAGRIIEIFPKHTTYIEPFAGGAQVFFRKPPSHVEILNDKSSELINLYSVWQNHYEEFLRYFKFVVVSRTWFDLLKNTDPASLTDIQRGARYFYLLKNCFAGLIVNPSYHRKVVDPPGFNLERLPELIENTHKRLERVQIECAPYEEILEHYDRKESLFYLDPPYYAKELYQYNFTHDDFEKLAARLAKLQGKFVLSLNDLPQVRALFRRFHIQEVELYYSSQPKAGRRYQEILITNFRYEAG
jgi:DNA adenine methylase